MASAVGSSLAANRSGKLGGELLPSVLPMLPESARDLDAMVAALSAQSAMPFAYATLRAHYAEYGQGGARLVELGQAKVTDLCEAEPVLSEAYRKELAAAFS